MVEAIANSVEDQLIDGLSFKMQPGASYVVERKSVTYHPQGSNNYEPGAGTNLIRILLTGDNWLDPSTLRLMFSVKNTNPAGNDSISNYEWSLVFLYTYARLSSRATGRRYRPVQPNS